jgi:hypothetical protein
MQAGGQDLMQGRLIRRAGEQELRQTIARQNDMVHYLQAWTPWVTKMQQIPGVK